MIIAVLGATGTGKTHLALGLRTWLATQAFEHQEHMESNTEVWDAPTWPELRALHSSLHSPNLQLLLMGLDLPHSEAIQTPPAQIHNEQAQQDSALRAQLQSQAWATVWCTGLERVAYNMRFDFWFRSTHLQHGGRAYARGAQTPIASGVCLLH